MCNICNTTPDYVGDLIPFDKCIDGGNQQFEVYIIDDVESDRYALTISGDHTDINILINFCPMCGEKLV